MLEPPSLADFIKKNKEEAEAKASTSNPDFDDLENDFSLETQAEYLYTPEQAWEKLSKGQRILGSPAAALTWGIDGNRNKASLLPGMDGEKIVASILNMFAQKTAGVFVFHSLSWPDSAGDTDHIVVYKNRVLIVDSKRWKASRKYSINSSFGIKRGTVDFPQGKVKIGGAIAAWRKKIPINTTVYGVVCIAQEKVFVQRDKYWYQAPYRLVESERLEEFLEEFVDGADKRDPDAKTSQKLLVFFGSLLVKPRDVLGQLINREALS